MQYFAARSAARFFCVEDRALLIFHIFVIVNKNNAVLKQKYLLLRLIRVAYAKERRVSGEIYQAR